MHRAQAKWLVLAIGSSALVSTAYAQDTRATPAALAAEAPPASGVADGQAVQSPFAGRAAGPAPSALGEQTLDAQRGAAAVTNIADTRGTLSNTSATNVVTGSNTVTEASFGNASGLSTVIQNTGANVLIQNSTIVNVQFKP